MSGFKKFLIYTNKDLVNRYITINYKNKFFTGIDIEQINYFIAFEKKVKNILQKYNILPFLPIEFRVIMCHNYMIKDRGLLFIYGIDMSVYLSSACTVRKTCSVYDTKQTEHMEYAFDDLLRSVISLKGPFTN